MVDFEEEEAEVEGADGGLVNCSRLLASFDPWGGENIRSVRAQEFSSPRFQTRTILQPDHWSINGDTKEQVVCISAFECVIQVISEVCALCTSTK